MDAMTNTQMAEVVALGWTLLHFCWQTTAIALVYALADRCAVRASMQVRYGLAIAALGMMALAAGVTFVNQESLLVEVERYQKHAVVSQLGPIHSVIIDQLPVAAPAMGNGELWIAEHADRLMPWIDGVWLSGVLLLSLRAAMGWWQLGTVRERAREMVPRRLSASFDRLAAQFQMGSRVALRVSTEVISPMVMGVWHITVLVPLSAAMSLAPEQLEAVLAHELAHVRRWDYLCNLLQTAVECLFFFHPAMWWVSRRAREFREVCCDEVAAKACADPVVYAEALLHLEEQRAKHLRLAVALHGDGGTLLNRIRRVLGEKAMEKKTIGGMRIVAAGLVLACLYAVPVFARGAKKHEEPQPHVLRLLSSDEAANGAAQTPSPIATPEPVAEGVAVASIAPTAEPLPAAEPEPAVRAEVAIAPAPSPHPMPMASPAPLPMAGEGNGQSGMQFIEGMRSAGYQLDLDKDLNVLVSLRAVGVTPEYAKAMAQAGFGTPSLHDLVSLRSVGVTPEYVAHLKGGEAAPADFHEVVAEKTLDVTPEYARAIAATKLGTPTAHDLISLKAQGITPAYIDELRAGGIVPEDLHQVVSLKAVGVTPEYAKSMAAAGFTGVSAHDLISMKAQGMTPDSVKWLRTTFPDADLNSLRRATALKIDPEFAASAKAHGFNSTNLDKLVKLKTSGLLN